MTSVVVAENDEESEPIDESLALQSPEGTIVLEDDDSDSQPLPKLSRACKRLHPSAYKENEESDEEDKYKALKRFGKKERTLNYMWESSANLPALSEEKPSTAYKNKDTTLWIPSESLDCDQVRLIEERMMAQNPMITMDNCRMTSDNEDLLYTLMKSNYDGALAFENACKKRISHPALPFKTWSHRPPPDGNCKHHVVFTPDEIECFEKAFIEYGKMFPRIREKLPQRKTGEMVEFYYTFFKYSARHKLLMEQEKTKSENYFDVDKAIYEQIVIEDGARV